MKKPRVKESHATVPLTQECTLGYAKENVQPGKNNEHYCEHYYEHYYEHNYEHYYEHYYGHYYEHDKYFHKINKQMNILRIYVTFSIY